MDFSLTSKYWKFLILKNLKELSTSGVAKYAETVARNYATWTDFNENQISNLCKLPLMQKNININKLHSGFSRSESLKHNMLISLLFSQIENDNLTKKLYSLSDDGYLFGGHPFHNLKGKAITLDKISSILEIKVFKECLVDDSIVCELGAGSGRTAEAIMTIYPKIRYIIADLPPASFIAKHRLNLVFPEKKIVVAQTFLELASFLESPFSWDVIFCLPSLLKFLPDKSIDLLLAIDCLHEMSDKMRNYVSTVVDSKSIYFYFKIWESTKIPLDNVELNSLSPSDYFIKDKWEILLDQEALFPGNFREFIFKIN